VRHDRNQAGKGRDRKESMRVNAEFAAIERDVDA